MTTATRIGVAIDTESLGLRPNSIMREYAVVFFDLDDPETILGEIEEYLPMQAQEKLSRSLSVDTFMWIARAIAKDPTYLDKLEKCQGDDIDELIAVFTAANRKFQEKVAGAYYEVWVRRPQHDIPMIQSILDDLGLDVAWKYDTINDVATLMNAAQVSVKDVDDSGLIKHTGIGDAKFLIRCYAEAQRRLSQVGASHTEAVAE